jgi:hypothetical protein
MQLVAKAFPGKASINQVIKTARSYWRAHPQNYIAIHCAYGAPQLQEPHAAIIEVVMPEDGECTAPQ